MATKRKVRKLTPKQEKFIAYYSGNGADAARKAGYQGDEHTLKAVAYENLTKHYIRAAIKKRHDVEIEHLVASRLDLQIFWSKVVTRPTSKMADRLKASELLGKSEAVFTDNIKTTGEIKTEVRIVNEEEVQAVVSKFDDNY